VRKSLTTGTLRSFDRVNLDLLDFNFNFPVCREVAEAGRPFFDRGGRLHANRTDGAVYNMIATFTHFDNVLAAAAFSDATFFAPEHALCIWENCLTLHWGTPLFKA